MQTIWVALWRGIPMTASTEQAAWDLLAERAALSAQHWLDSGSPNSADWWIERESRGRFVMPTALDEVRS